MLEGSTIHSDGWKAYDGLILNGYDHYRVFHSENEFARRKYHVNGIENVQTLFAWSFAKRRLSKFNGCDSDKFVIHLMECEWRYNHRNEDLYKELTKILKRY
ncbi:MAG: transposase [Treponema sp.]|nr:transposase [Treponema sp.]